jgi:hypothetical protein
MLSRRLTALPVRLEPPRRPKSRTYSPFQPALLSRNAKKNVMDAGLQNQEKDCVDGSLEDIRQNTPRVAAIGVQHVREAVSQQRLT